MMSVKWIFQKVPRDVSYYTGGNVNIGLGNDLVLSANTSLPDLMLTNSVDSLLHRL